VWGLTGLRRLTLAIEGRKDSALESPKQLRQLSLVEELRIDAPYCGALECPA